MDSVAPDLARYYDLDLEDDPGDVEMYMALAASIEGPILELAVGSGRIAVPLAEAGYRVTGIDRDPAMLARARNAASKRPAAAGSLTLVEADMTDPGLNGLASQGFDLVILGLNSLMLLPDRDAQLSALKTMASRLALEGRAVIDVWLPTPDDLALYDGRLLLDWVRLDPETDELVAKSTSATFSPASQTATISTFFDAWREGGPTRRTSRVDHVLFIGASELVALARTAGLRTDITAGDHAMGVFAPDSERIVLVCRPDSD